MEESKYYIPTIDEFCYGLQYEFRGSIGWHKRTYGLADYLYESDLTEELVEGNIRVKYLDTEDIESLGWKFIIDKSIISNYEHSINKEIQLYCNDKCSTGNLHIGITIYMEKDKIFNGWIQNKLELVKLMKQLGI